MPRLAALYNRRKWHLIDKSQWCKSAMLQLQHTPPPQTTTPGLHPVSIHQMSPPVRGRNHPITAYYSVYRPRKNERLSRPGWLVTYRNKVPPTGVEPGHVTHPSTNRARRRVTSLIRPTMLPLRHAAKATKALHRNGIVQDRQWRVANCWTIVVLLDYSAAFDTVDHAVALAILEKKFVISHFCLQWFCSYLSSRTFSVIANSQTSETDDLYSSLPQGLTLGPLLYLT